MPRRCAAALAIATCLVAAATLSGCGSSSTAQGSSSAPKVVATTTQLGDFVREVGGDRVDVAQILRPNSDPHEYEPRPSDVLSSADAKVVFESGDNLDAWMAKIISQSGGHPRIVDVGAAVPTKLPGQASGPEASMYDPHWWHDPRNAEAAIRVIRDALSALNPSAKATYAHNAAAYIAKLKALDARVRRCFARVPSAERKLVTDHDAFSYFAHRYGIDVIGAVIPSQTTEAQPSARSVADLSTLIRREHVKAIFPESSINPKLAQALARESGATSNYTLYGDTLGPKGSPGATYLTMEAANADAMVRGFTGGKLGCPAAP